MLNKTEPSKNPRPSKFLGNRRKKFLNPGKEQIVIPDSPLQIKQKPEIYCKVFAGGIYRVKYVSKSRTAFGYGTSLPIAFENMNRNFTDKYLSDGQ